MRRALAPVSVLLVTTGCAAISGFNELEKVDCVDCAQDAARDTAVVEDTLGVDTAIDDSGADTVASDSATADDTVAPETSSDTATTDTATTDTAASDAVADASFTCPAGAKGPTMINVGGFCVDATEVTTSQYAVFLVAKGSDTTGQPAGCAWNTSYTPLYWPQTGLETHPVMGVDWCDAYAYCKWAGKRLCGAIGGGSTPYASHASAATSQWFAACSQRGARAYPYGASYVAAACQDGSIKPARTVPAGTKLACDGGYAGILDMSGNIQEWEDSCNGASGSGDLCRVRGGMLYDSGSADLACAAPRGLARNTRNDHTGFRCCAD